MRNLVAFHRKIQRIQFLVAAYPFVHSSGISDLFPRLSIRFTRLHGSFYSVNGEHFPSVAKSQRNKVLRDLSVY